MTCERCSELEVELEFANATWDNNYPKLEQAIDQLTAQNRALREAAQAYLDNRTGGRDRLVALLQEQE